MEVISRMLPWDKWGEVFKKREACICLRRCPKHIQYELYETRSDRNKNKNLNKRNRVTVTNISENVNGSVSVPWSWEVYLQLLNFSCGSSVTIVAESLTVEGSGVSVRIVFWVLGLHFLHPGHAPVPSRNRLQFAEWVAFCMERWVQGAEGGGRRREI